MKRPNVSFRLAGLWMFFLVGLGATPGVAQEKATAGSRVFQQVLRYVQQHYVDSIPLDQLYQMSILGLLDRLGDPYTTFVGAPAFKQLSNTVGGKYVGVGIEIELRSESIYVASVLDGGPAWQAGLACNDVIVSVDSGSVRGKRLQQVTSALLGRPGATVSIGVVRPGVREPMTFRILRRRLRPSPLEGPVILTSNISYVRIRSMTDSAATDLAGALTETVARGGRALVLDLRDNPGGFSEESRAIAELFLDSGLVVVEKRRRGSAMEVLRTSATPRWPDLPMVVLVNERTASAAEVLAAALQEHRRAVLLGARTFGKGVSYAILPLATEEALIVTTARWFTPNGFSVDRRHGGEAETDTGLSGRTRPAERLHTSGHGIQPDIIQDTGSEEQGNSEFLGCFPDDMSRLKHQAPTDVQMQRALRLLRSASTTEDLLALAGRS